ncbi:hypothetical protein [Vibrio crassostreae]|uniref:hypothetical protein n=1 Tax=Vibrio crassostreae TaxID=246167 RepID=UPI001B300D0C|nr:hypothetical protein [Vibrio crassostreae]
MKKVKIIVTLLALQSSMVLAGSTEEYVPKVTKGKPAIPYQTKSFITLGANIQGEYGESNLTSSAGVFNYHGNYGVQLSSLGSSQGERWEGSEYFKYVQNTTSFRIGTNYKVNEFLYPYVELGYGKTETDGMGASGTQKYATGEVGIYLRPISMLTISAGYHFANTPDEIIDLNGWAIRGGFVF